MELYSTNYYRKKKVTGYIPMFSLLCTSLPILHVHVHYDAPFIPHLHALITLIPECFTSLPTNDP